MTGFYPYPHCSPPDGSIACSAPAATIGRRLQVKEADIDTSASVQYFYQFHLITPDERYRLAMARQ